MREPRRGRKGTRRCGRAGSGGGPPSKREALAPAPALPNRRNDRRQRVSRQGSCHQLGCSGLLEPPETVRAAPALTQRRSWPIPPANPHHRAAGQWLPMISAAFAHPL